MTQADGGVPPPPSLPPSISSAADLLQPVGLLWTEATRRMLAKGHSTPVAEHLAMLWLWKPGLTKSPPFPPSPPPLAQSTHHRVSIMPPTEPQPALAAESTLEKILAEGADSVLQPIHTSRRSRSPVNLKIKSFQQSIVTLEKDALDQVARQKEENMHMEWMMKFNKGEDHTTCHSEEVKREHIRRKEHDSKQRKSSIPKVGQLGEKLRHFGAALGRKSKLGRGSKATPLDMSLVDADESDHGASRGNLNAGLAKALDLPAAPAQTQADAERRMRKSIHDKYGSLEQPAATGPAAAAHMEVRPLRKSTGSYNLERLSPQPVADSIHEGDDSSSSSIKTEVGRLRTRSKSASSLALRKAAKLLSPAAGAAEHQDKDGTGADRYGRRSRNGEAMWVSKGGGTSPVGSDVDRGKILADQLQSFSKARSKTITSVKLGGRGSRSQRGRLRGRGSLRPSPSSSPAPKKTGITHLRCDDI